MAAAGAGAAAPDQKCDICGVVGYPECMMTCSVCQKASEHTYCMRNSFNDYSEKWICESCQLSTQASPSPRTTNECEHVENDTDTSPAASPSSSPSIQNMTSLKNQESVRRQRSLKISEVINEGLFIPEDQSRQSIHLSNSYRGHVTKASEKAKVKFISAEEVAGLASGSTAKSPTPPRCASRMPLPKRRFNDMHPYKPSMANSEKTNAFTNATKEPSSSKPCLESKSQHKVEGTHLKSTVMHKNLSGCSSRGKSISSMDAPLGFHKVPLSGRKVEQGQECLEIQLKSNILWRGSFIIVGSDTVENVLDGIVGRGPELICRKAYKAIRQMPRKLALTVEPFSTIWPQSFCTSPPDVDDVAMYFVADNADGSFFEFLDTMRSKKMALRYSMDVADMLIFGPELLSDSNVKNCCWGFFSPSQQKQQSHHEAWTCTNNKTDLQGKKEVEIGDVVHPISTKTSTNDQDLLQKEASEQLCPVDDLAVDMDIDMVGGKDVGRSDVVVQRSRGHSEARFAASDIRIKKNPSFFCSKKSMEKKVASNLSEECKNKPKEPMKTLNISPSQGMASVDDATIVCLKRVYQQQSPPKDVSVDSVPKMSPFCQEVHCNEAGNLPKLDIVKEEMECPEMPDFPPGFNPIPPSKLSPSRGNDVDGREQAIEQDNTRDSTPKYGRHSTSKAFGFPKGKGAHDSHGVHEFLSEKCSSGTEVFAEEGGHTVETGLAITKEQKLLETSNKCLDLFPMDPMDSPSNTKCTTGRFNFSSESLGLTLSRPRYLIDGKNIISELSKEKLEQDGCGEGEQIRLTI